MSKRPGGSRQAERLRGAIELHRAGKLAEAEAIYRSVLRLRPNQPDALHFLGMLAHQQGRHDEALRLIRRSTEVAPSYPDAFNNLGNILRAAGRNDEAEACYRRALALRPSDADAHCNLAGVLLNVRGELAAAESACRQALELDPRHPGAYTNLGLVLERQGRESEAMGAFTAAIALDPAHPEASKLLGLALIADGRVDEARAVYRSWLDRDPVNPVAAHLFAACAGEVAPGRASDGYVRSVFDGLADSFDEHLGKLDYRAPELVAQALVRRLEGSAAVLRVLDAGCGTGLCAHFLRRYAARLVGVDLSPRMLAHALRRGLYDELVESELTAYLAAQPAAYELVVCTDTFCYFGDLEIAMRAAYSALTGNGFFVFTVEQAQVDAHQQGYRLAHHGRYAHGEHYVRDVLESTGFAAIEIEHANLRKEGGQPVAGLVCSATTLASPD